VIARLAEQPRGLVLVTGPTGSGKTTTLAAMIDHVNANRAVHIVTIEDPIEVLHADAAETVNRCIDLSHPSSSARSGCRWPPPCAASSASAWSAGPSSRSWSTPAAPPRPSPTPSAPATWPRSSPRWSSAARGLVA